MKKILMMVIAVVLIVVISVSATLAYLTDTEAVVNTFTVGDIDITLDETVDEDYATLDENGNASFEDIVPGHTYVKAPVVTVKADSEKCYVFVKLENELAGIEAEGDTIEEQILANGWEPLETGVYYKVVDKAGTDTELPVFETVSIEGETLGNAALQAYEGKTIKVTAFAVQFEGMADADAAWTAAQSATAYERS